MGIRVSEKTLKAKEFDLGYPRGFHDEFAIGHRLGKGGSGTVTHATRRSDGAEFAIKAIPKILRDPAASERKRALQIPSIQREVEVLLALRGTLNVATLEAVYEDDKDVFLVLELCRGGELLHGKGGHGREVLTERRVASYMRAILQTVAQCHARNILHRDIKPENFMHASTDPTAPIKAIDFGLAAFCPLNSLPLTAPNVEGTPWYLAPEACRGKWWPATDVWACGIMAAYMLTGYYPFIDRITPNMPDLARTLKVICYEELDLSGQEWQGLSSEAVDFVKLVLIKDLEKRPTAIAALAHPFLSDDPNKADRPLHRSVVQRIQRFAQSGIFKRRVLEYVARDLVRMHFAADPDRSAHGGAVFKDRSVRGGHAYYENSRRGPKLDSSTRSMSKATAAAILAAAEDASRRCPPVSSDRSASHRGDASSHLASYIGNKPLPAGVYLPVATPYSRRLSVVLDSLDSDGDGRVARSDLQAALKKLGYRVEEAEAAELFDVVDVERRGAVERAELSASLLDWKWLQDTFKDRWVESVQRVFQNLDKDGDGALDANEVAAAFSGHLDDYEVDAAVHEALMEAFADEGEDAGDEEGALKHQRIDFDHFLRLLQTGRYLEDLELYDDRLSEHSSRVVTGEFKPVAQSDRKGGGIGSLFRCCMGQ